MVPRPQWVVLERPSIEKVYPLSQPNQVDHLHTLVMCSPRPHPTCFSQRQARRSRRNFGVYSCCVHWDPKKTHELGWVGKVIGFLVFWRDSCSSEDLQMFSSKGGPSKPRNRTTPNFLCRWKPSCNQLGWICQLYIHNINPPRGYKGVFFGGFWSEYLQPTIYNTQLLNPLVHSIWSLQAMHQSENSSWSSQ